MGEQFTGLEQVKGGFGGLTGHIDSQFLHHFLNQRVDGIRRLKSRTLDGKFRAAHF
jgi:hypothetical protein